MIAVLAGGRVRIDEPSLPTHRDGVVVASSVAGPANVLAPTLTVDFVLWVEAQKGAADAAEMELTGFELRLDQLRLR
jgi:hypothetical protein